jgi:hypothetical protein
MTGLGAVLKIAWEMAAGEALLTSTAWPSVPEVHGVGLLCGLLLSVLLPQLKRWDNSWLPT